MAMFAVGLNYIMVAMVEGIFLMCNSQMAHHSLDEWKKANEVGLSNVTQMWLHHLNLSKNHYRRKDLGSKLVELAFWNNCNLNDGWAVGGRQ